MPFEGQQLYLIHILESIGRAEEYASEGLEDFLSDKKTQDYLGVNLVTVWGIIEGPLKELKMKINEVLEGMPKS